MTKHFLLNKSLVQKVAKATNSVLILQWAHNNTLSKHWNATDPDRSKTTHALSYWLMAVVKDDEPRSAIELMQAARAACKGQSSIAVHIYRRKEALRKLKNNHGDFAMVYRLGYPLYNADKKTFPCPGYARKNKAQPPVRPMVAML